MTPAEEAIERFLAMFGEPRTPNPERFLAEYAKALTGIEGPILEAAVDRVMRTATFWPKPAEVLQEVNHVAAERYKHRAVDWDAVEADRKSGWKFGDLAKSAPSDEARARAQAMVDEMKRNLASISLDANDPMEPDWKRGQIGGFWRRDR